jgi:hypothetical protein
MPRQGAALFGYQHLCVELVDGNSTNLIIALKNQDGAFDSSDLRAKDLLILGRIELSFL